MTRYAMVGLISVLTPGLLLAACGSTSDANQTAAVTNFVPPATRAPTPLPGQAQTTPITAYVGKYPHDAVDGVDFYDRTDVAKGLVDAVGDAKLRETIRGRSGPETPIFRRDGAIAAWGCEAHNCGNHNWTVLVAPTDGRTQVCHHDAEAMGETSRWYAAGAAPAVRPGACPAEQS